MNLPFRWSEWCGLAAIDLARLVNAQQVTAEEVAAQAAVAVELVNPELQASREIFDDAVADPVRAGARSGGPLYGVPMFMKDSGSGMAGRLREWGSRLSLGQRADQDCPLVLNLRAAGINLLGRSSLPESGRAFDTTFATDDQLIVTRNPWNLERTPGGSSGGSAALVAAGVVPCAKAGDAAGSTRVPAALTGLVGLKPTRGLLPSATGTNELTNHRLTEGALTRNVVDQAIILDCMIGSQREPHFVPQSKSFPGPFLHQIQQPPSSLRVGVSTGTWGLPGECASRVAERVWVVGRALAGLGHNIEEVRDEEICDWARFWSDFAIGWKGSAIHWWDLAETRGWSQSYLRDRLAPQNVGLLDAAESITLRAFRHSIDGNPLSTGRVRDLLTRIDVLLCPVFGQSTPFANGPFSLFSKASFSEWFDNFLRGARYTALGNETGIPSLAIPTGLDNEALPVGALMYGRHLSDGMLLQLARQLELSYPDWFSTCPPYGLQRFG
jgi:amidase